MPPQFGVNRPGVAAHNADRFSYRITYQGRKYEVADPDANWALAELIQLRENLKQGIRVVDGKQSLRTFAEYCYAQRLSGKETTKYDRNKRFRSCIAPILGDRRLCDITTPEVSGW